MTVSLGYIFGEITKFSRYLKKSLKMGKAFFTDNGIKSSVSKCVKSAVYAELL